MERVTDMGWIGPRRNRREVAGPAAGPMGPMPGRTRELAAAGRFFGWFLITPEASFDIICLAEIFGPALEGIDTGFKFIQFEGFGEVIVRAQVQA